MAQMNGSTTNGNEKAASVHPRLVLPTASSSPEQGTQPTLKRFKKDAKQVEGDDTIDLTTSLKEMKVNNTPAVHPRPLEYHRPTVRDRFELKDDLEDGTSRWFPGEIRAISGRPARNYTIHWDDVTYNTAEWKQLRSSSFRKKKYGKTWRFTDRQPDMQPPPLPTPKDVVDLQPPPLSPPKDVVVVLDLALSDEDTDEDTDGETTSTRLRLPVTPHEERKEEAALFQPMEGMENCYSRDHLDMFKEHYSYLFQFDLTNEEMKDIDVGLHDSELNPQENAMAPVPTSLEEFGELLQQASANNDRGALRTLMKQRNTFMKSNATLSKKSPASPVVSLQQQQQQCKDLVKVWCQCGDEDGNMLDTPTNPIKKCPRCSFGSFGCMKCWYKSYQIKKTCPCCRFEIKGLRDLVPRKVALLERARLVSVVAPTANVLASKLKVIHQDLDNDRQGYVTKVEQEKKRQQDKMRRTLKRNKEKRVEKNKNRGKDDSSTRNLFQELSKENRNN